MPAKIKQSGCCLPYRSTRILSDEFLKRTHRGSSCFTRQNFLRVSADNHLIHLTLDFQGLFAIESILRFGSQYLPAIIEHKDFAVFIGRKSSRINVDIRIDLRRGGGMLLLESNSPDDSVL